MSQETNISSWLHANFESGIDTDVVPKEQLWQSYLQSFSTTAGGIKITRDQFFFLFGTLLQDDAFNAVKTMKNRGKKIGYRCLRRKKVLVKEQEVVNVKASKVMNVESRPFRQEIGTNQDRNDLNEESRRVRQEDPTFLERQPDQRRKASPLNFEAEKEEDVESDPPAQDLGMEAENLDYVSPSDVCHEERSEEVPLDGFSKEMVQDVSGIKTGGPSGEQMEGEQFGSPEASNVEDVESDDSFDDAFRTMSTSEDSFSDTSKEKSDDLEERSPGAKRRAVLVGKPDNERRKLKLSSKRVPPRSRGRKVGQKHSHQSKGLKFRVQDETLVGRNEQRNISLLSDSVSSEEEVEVLRQPTNAIPNENSSFYQRNYKNINSLLPKHLPGGPKSFRDYLRKLFVAPDVTNLKRIEIYRHCGETSNLLDARCRAFIATSFPPIKVGCLAGKEVEHTFSGDLFPQKTKKKMSQYQCEVCLPYQKWAIEGGFRHASYKSKCVNVNNITDGTAVLSFSELYRLMSIYQSRAHKEAIEFFQTNDRKDAKNKDALKPAKKEKGIEDFFKPQVPLN